MRRCALALIAVMATPALADDRDLRRAQCAGWMMAGGYPSGMAEKSCQSDFALSSGFLIKCARAQRQGFADARQRAACTVFFAQAAPQAEQGYVLN